MAISSGGIFIWTRKLSQLEFYDYIDKEMYSCLESYYKKHYTNKYHLSFDPSFKDYWRKYVQNGSATAESIDLSQSLKMAISKNSDQYFLFGKIGTNRDFE